MRTLTPEREAILTLMADGNARKPSEVAIILGKSVNSITIMMHKMIATGHLMQPAYGQYVIVKRHNA